MEKPDPTALIDLDGTVADFDRRMKEILEEIRSPNEDPKFDDTVFEDVPHMKARRRLIKAMPGFWRHLPVISAGMDIVKALLKFKFRLHVLTKGPKQAFGAYSEKVEWCRQYMPEGTPVTISDDKGLVYGKILVDDWPSYIDRWLACRPRGYVISVAQPWNIGIDERPNVLRYDPTEPGATDRMHNFISGVRARYDATE